MDPMQPWQPVPPQAAPGTTSPVEWAAPALGTPAPGTVQHEQPPGAEQPRGTTGGTNSLRFAPAGAAPVQPALPPADDEAPVTRAIFRDGQRLLYYSVNFARLLSPQRVYGHARLYEALLTLALIRLHSGLERLIRAQMPMARPTAPVDQDQEANWGDMLVYLRNQYPRLVLPADALFLTDITRLRNLLVRGEILSVDLNQLGNLAKLGDAIFLQLDPEYRRWEPEPDKDVLPARPTAAAQPAAAPAAEAASTPAPAPAPPTTVTPVGNPAAPPLAEWMAAGAQRPRPPVEEKLYCPTCGREVLADDLWCPRCGENFTAPNALQPLTEPPVLAAPPSAAKRRGVFARLLGVR